MEFRDDASVAAESAKVAASWVNVVKRHFGVELDYSDASIRDLERVAEEIFRTKPPVEEQSDDFLLAFRQFTDQTGAYLGEVLRRNHGAKWGYSVVGKTREMAMLTPSGNIIWPVERAQKRLINGREGDLWHYFKTLA